MTAFARDSISLRLYPHQELEAPDIVATMREQAAQAVRLGFDGVMTSEHHGGFGGYTPNPIQLTGWLLEAMPSGWAAPCPLLLPLRPVALVAEELAWLAARHPGRVGAGVAPGSLPLDFSVMEIPIVEMHDRFRAGLPRLVELLNGRNLGELADDRALQACSGSPIPVLATAMSPGAARRAAAAGAGLLFEGASSVDKLSRLAGEYRGAGGTAPIVLIRRVWLGEPPTDSFAAQQALYRTYSTRSAQAGWTGNGLTSAADADRLATELVDAIRTIGAAAINLRIHAPGLAPRAIGEQLDVLGGELLPRLRQEFANRRMSLVVDAQAARRRRIRSSVAGWVENNLARSTPPPRRARPTGQRVVDVGLGLRRGDLHRDLRRVDLDPLQRPGERLAVADQLLRTTIGVELA